MQVLLREALSPASPAEHETLILALNIYHFTKYFICATESYVGRKSLMFKVLTLSPASPVGTGRRVLLELPQFDGFIRQLFSRLHDQAGKCVLQLHLL